MKRIRLSNEMIAEYIYEKKINSGYRRADLSPREISNYRLDLKDSITGKLSKDEKISMDRAYKIIDLVDEMFEVNE